MLNNIIAQLGTGAGGGGGAFESIATYTPTSGSSVTFTSIPSTYQHLQIRYSFKVSSSGTGALLYVNFNGATGTSYSRHSLYGDGSTAAAAGNASTGYPYVSEMNLGADTTYQTVGIIDVLDYASSTKNKTFRTLTGVDNNGSGGIDLLSGAWYNTNAITSIDIKLSTSSFAAGSIALYGIKGS